MTEAHETIRVASDAELAAALDTALGAAGPVTVALAPGRYWLDTGRDFAHTVTLVSEDPSDPAVFEHLFVIGGSNMVFDGFVFDWDWETSDSPAEFRIVEGAADITVRNSLFDGDLIPTDADDIFAGFPGGGGLVMKGDRLKAENNVFHTFGTALSLEGFDHEIVGNDISGIRVDAIHASHMQGLLIEGNHIHDPIRADGLGDHADQIQIWPGNRGAVPAERITIRNNVFDSGASAASQTIFIANDKVAAGVWTFEEGAFKDILIEDNIIFNGHPAGIFVGATLGLTIQNNTILSNTYDERWGGPVIRLDNQSEEVVVANNVTGGLNFEASESWLVHNNLVVQNDRPEGANYVGELFVNAGSAEHADVADLQALPGGIVEEMGVGAARTRFDATPEALTALAKVREVSDAWGEVTADGTLSAGPDGLLGPDATFRWDFGDGTVVEGAEATHAYTQAGRYLVRLEVATAEGLRDAATAVVEVPEPLLLRLVSEGGQIVDTSPYAERPSVVGDAGPVPGREGEAFALGSETDIRFERGTVEQIAQLRSHTMLFGLKAANGSPGDAGTLLHIHGDREVLVTGEGEVELRLATTDGGYTVRTQGAGLLDGAWHDLAIAYDAAAGRVEIYVDGARLAEAGVTGETVGAFRDIVVGQTWAGDFTGALDHLEIRIGALGAAEIAERHGAAPAPAPAALPEATDLAEAWAPAEGLAPGIGARAEDAPRAASDAPREAPGREPEPAEEDALAAPSPPDRATILEARYAAIARSELGARLLDQAGLLPGSEAEDTLL